MKSTEQAYLSVQVTTNYTTTNIIIAQKWITSKVNQHSQQQEESSINSNNNKLPIK